MARKLFCKLNHERGEKFSVAGKLYTIGADGYVEVDDEHAPLLLQNDGKWADPSLATAPYKRPNGPPALILADAQGRVLSPEETAKAMQASKPAEPAKAAEEPAMDPEPAPPEWPSQSTDTSKHDLLANLEKLKIAGHVQPGDFNHKMSKTDLLEVIERAYDSMS